MTSRHEQVAPRPVNNALGGNDAPNTSGAALPPAAVPQAEPPSSAPLSNDSQAATEDAEASRQRVRAWMRALKAGDQPKVVELLEAGVELERRDAFENTPLILACHYAHEPLALELLRRGADATAANEQGCTALLHACIEGLPTLAEELLLRPAVLPAPAPAPVYSRHTDETAPRTPLLGAAESGFAHGVRLLLRRGVPPEPEALTLAAAHGHAEVCSLLLATALATAAATATAAAAAAATAAAAPEAGALDAGAALLAAVRHGHAAAARVLLGSPDGAAATPAAAAEAGAVAGAEALWAVCSLPKALAKPAPGSASSPQVELAELLCAAGAPVNQAAEDGTTPLHLAARAGHAELSRVLLRCGADASATVDGSTAAELAQQAGHDALAAELQAPAEAPA
jgi:ankyrin repeat protein